MQKMMKVAVMVASFGFISAVHADNQLPSKSGVATSATSSTTGNATSSTGSATSDQVLVGGSATSSASQTSSNQGTLGQHDHGHDEDMD